MMLRVNARTRRGAAFLSLCCATVVLLGWLAGARSAPEPLTLPAEERVSQDAMWRIGRVPWTLGPHVNLSAVRWTAPRKESLGDLADRWGTTSKLLRALNPETCTDPVTPGQVFVVYRATDGELSRAVGSPNRGRVEHSVAFPEGQGWVLRPWRHRAYGTKRVVETLAAALVEFHRDHPGTPPLLLGDIGNRRGGRAPPHRSHQSGLDVDLGYVVAEMPSKNSRWRTVRPSEFDAEKNWALMRRLLATGVVEHIYVDNRLQRRLLEVARQELSPEELERTFALAAVGRRKQALAAISHWKGHDDHMHIRFACGPADLRCSGSEGTPRKSTKKR